MILIALIGIEEDLGAETGALDFWVLGAGSGVLGFWKSFGGIDSGFFWGFGSGFLSDI